MLSFKHEIDISVSASMGKLEKEKVLSENPPRPWARTDELLQEFSSYVHVCQQKFWYLLFLGTYKIRQDFSFAGGN